MIIATFMFGLTYLYLIKKTSDLVSIGKLKSNISFSGPIYFLILGIGELITWWLLVNKIF